MGSLENGTERGNGEEVTEQEEEPILMEQTQRFCMLPVRYKQVWEMYKKAEASFWTGNLFMFPVRFSCFLWILVFFLAYVNVFWSGFLLVS